MEQKQGFRTTTLMKRNPYIGILILLSLVLLVCNIFEQAEALDYHHGPLRRSLSEFQVKTGIKRDPDTNEMVTTVVTTTDKIPDEEDFEKKIHRGSC